VCLRSGLRPSLRHTTRTVPQLSHEHWYKNWGGVRYNGQNSILYGKNPSSGIHDLVFRNLKIAGKLVLDAEGGRIDINKFVSRVTFM